jgi:glucans biosynthesis protein C
MDTKSSTRNNYLDWLRVLAILFVFVYHSTRFFNLEDWEVKNPVRYEWVELWNLFAWNWMMPIIFVISGASLFYAVGRGSAGKFVKDKVLRLLVPYLVAVLTHATLQVYLNWITHGHFNGSYFQFLPRYFSEVFGNGPLFIFELWDMHLWYLLWLFIFTLLLYQLMRWLKGRGRKVLDAMGSFLARPGAVYLLALPTVLLMAFGNPDNPLIAEKAGGWSLVIYLWLLFTGFIVISAERLQASIQRLRWLSLGIGAVLLTGVLSIVVVTHSYPSYGTLLYSFGLGAAGFSSWCWVLAFFGLAMRYLDYRKPVLEYGNEAVLPFYILHQSVLICVGYFIVKWPIPDLLKWATILVSSFAIIMGLYEYLIRRANVLRFLFGMKVAVRAAAVQPQEPQAIEPARTL